MGSDPMHDPLTPAEVANIDRYRRAMHGVQSAIALDLERPETATAATPKQLRVGVDSAMVNDLALATLLIRKGVFTRAEYYAAIADAAEQEVRQRESVASLRFNAEIRFS